MQPHRPARPHSPSCASGAAPCIYSSADAKRARSRSPPLEVRFSSVKLRRSSARLSGSGSRARSAGARRRGEIGAAPPRRHQGPPRGSGHRHQVRHALEGDRPVGVDGSSQNARRAGEGSLKRLGVDTIDLFYQHRVDPDVHIEETIGGMAELVKEGKSPSSACPSRSPPPCAARPRFTRSQRCRANARTPNIKPQARPWGSPEAFIQYASV